jgi:hypothetical protein
VPLSERAWRRNQFAWYFAAQKGQGPGGSALFFPVKKMKQQHKEPLLEKVSEEMPRCGISLGKKTVRKKIFTF